MSRAGWSRAKGRAVSDDPSKSYDESLADFLGTMAPVVPIGKGRKRKIIFDDDGTNRLLSSVRGYLSGRLSETGDILEPRIECIAPTGTFKTIPYGNQRARTKTKAQMVRAMHVRGCIPEHVSKNREAIIGALEMIAEQEYRSAWDELDERINTYEPWANGYDPYRKLIYAIGDERHKTDTQLFLDMHCGLRHFFMQIKRVVAGVSTKDDYPITLIGYGPAVSGKSTLFKMIFRTIFGEWFKLDNFRLLSDEFRQKRASALPVIMMDEMEKAAGVSKEEFKNFISTSTLMCRGIFTDEINDDDNIASLVCLTNEEPPFGLYDESEGIARRVLPFACHHKKFRERESEILQFTEDDALALITGLDISDDRIIWNERAESLSKRQQVMRAPTFVDDWLEHSCVKFAEPFDSMPAEVKQKRRWHIREVIESMAEFKRTVGRKAFLSTRPRTVALELRKAGATVKQSKNDFYLVSHFARNGHYVDDGELQDF